MSDLENIDYPPANSINAQYKINEIIENEEECPFIRCENCHEILVMS